MGSLEVVKTLLSTPDCPSGLAGSGTEVAHLLLLSARAADLPIVAEYPARHGLVCLGWFEWVQAVCSYQRSSRSKPDQGLLRSRIEVLEADGLPVMTLSALNMIRP
jgi:hypothetical protein